MPDTTGPELEGQIPQRRQSDKNDSPQATQLGDPTPASIVRLVQEARNQPAKNTEAEITNREEENPGFRAQYERNYQRIKKIREAQNLGSNGPNNEHLKAEVLDKTKEDFELMTGALRRDVGEKEIGEIAKEIENTGESAILAYVDINFLKQINKKWKHRGGDFAIRLVGSAIKKSIRQEDIVTRWGGDELLILFRNLTKEQAKNLIQERLFANLIEGVAVSVGISKLSSNSEESIQQGDKAMFIAKTASHESGQNEIRDFDELTAEQKLLDSEENAS